MRPQIFQVFNQKAWPKVGDTDDCWVLASLQAVHTVAPWLRLPDAKQFRTAAGVPDIEGVDDPGNQKKMARGIRTLFPDLKVAPVNDMSFADFAVEVKRGRPAALIVDAGALPLKHRFGFTGIHAITVAVVRDRWRVMNPLAKPHSKPMKIEQDDLRTAVHAFNLKVHAVLMPTIEKALVTHEIHQAQVAALDRRIADLAAKLTAAGIDPGLG